MDAPELPLGRIEAFSDGVFAIGITLLILEIRVPDLPPAAGDRAVWQALGALWPSFLAFAGSFGTILTMWMHHRELFAFVTRVDRRLLWANGLLLLLITFIPFPTAVLARYLGRSGARAGTAFYCGAFFLIALAFQALLAAIARPGDRPRGPAAQRTLEAIRRSYRLGPVSYGAAFVLALLVPLAGFLLCGFMWLFWSIVEFRAPAAEEGP